MPFEFFLRRWTTESLTQYLSSKKVPETVRRAETLLVTRPDLKRPLSPENKILLGKLEETLQKHAFYKRFKQYGLKIPYADSLLLDLTLLGSDALEYEIAVVRLLAQMITDILIHKKPHKTLVNNISGELSQLMVQEQFECPLRSLQVTLLADTLGFQIKSQESTAPRSP